MTVQELVDYCNENNIPLDTHIAMNAKDDYMLTKDSISLDNPYFGNCSDGTKFEQEHYPRDENGDIDYESEDVPKFLVLYTGRG